MPAINLPAIDPRVVRAMLRPAWRRWPLAVLIWTGRRILYAISFIAGMIYLNLRTASLLIMAACVLVCLHFASHHDWKDALKAASVVVTVAALRVLLRFVWNLHARIVYR